MRKLAGRKFRVLGLLAILGVVALLSAPVVVPILLTDRYVSRTDIGAAPPARVSPALPLTEADAREMLRRRGYVDISDLARDESGAWRAKAAKEANGPKITVSIDRNGGVSER
jgi:hypothetical protein